MKLYTVGHGSHSSDRLLQLLQSVGIRLLIDVRSAPGSRRHPQFRQAAMREWLEEAGLAYLWEPALGGFRKPAPHSPHHALAEDGLRAYADYMLRPEFRHVLRDTLTEAGRHLSAVMCAESDWRHCHRSKIADAAHLLEGVEVHHLMPDGSLQIHQPDPRARLVEDRLIYDQRPGELPF